MTAPVEARPEPALVNAQPPSGRPRRPLLAWAGVVAVTFSGIVGGNFFGIRDAIWEPATPEAAPPASGPAAGATPADGTAAAPTSLRSQPWWQDVATL